MAKIRRAKLPFKVLNEIEEEATRELETLLDRGMTIIEAELRNAVPGDDEFILTGANISKLQKNTEVPQSVREYREYQRRIIHKAPMNLNQLTEGQVKEIIRELDWDGGTLWVEGNRISGKGEALISDEAIPLSLIKLTDIRVDDLKTALLNKRGKVTLLKKAGYEEYHIKDGAAFIFAARIVNLPAVEALVEHYDEVTISSTQKGRRETEITLRARSLVKEDFYRLPSHLEPLGELARRHSLDVLDLAFTGDLSLEEIEARDKYNRREQELRRLWVLLYNEQRNLNKDDKEASRIVRSNPKWIRLETLVEAQLQLASKVKTRWVEIRESCLRARDLIKLYAEQDGIEVDRIDIESIYVEANKGQPSKEENSMGNPVGAYEVGERVEVLSGDGIWHSAEVIRTSDDRLRVRREDGQYRVIEDPSSIRRDGEGKLSIDKEGDIEYNKGMEEIKISKFKVVVPLGSNSLRIERSLEAITEEMNSHPLQVNKTIWERNRASCQKELERLTQECHEMAGRPFRPNSPKDCKEILIEDMNLVAQRVNKATGEPSIDKDALQAWENEGEPLAGKIIEAREAQSKVSQLNKWAEYAESGEVQCTWNQQGTPMGRYSCDTPNLQNRITEVRETIESPEGYRLLSFDLGQAEYVTWASLSGDPTLTSSFSDGTDFHIRMYEEIKSAAENINFHEEDPRQMGKTINFALLYLMQPFVLAKKLGISTIEATELIRVYQDRAPVATAYIEDFLKLVQKTGRTYTHFGRTRFMPEMQRAKGPALHQARKTAWHHHNSGTAAELLKIKQIRVHRALRREGFEVEDARIIINMHDEIILLVKTEYLDQVKEIASRKFAEDIPGFLPFKITEKTGRTWLEVSK